MHDPYDVYNTNRAPIPAAAVTLGAALSTFYAGNCVIEYMAFANTHNADIKVTVKDGNGKTFLPGVTVAAGETEIVKIPEGGLFFHGGLKWMAATADKVDAWVRLREV
jgi:hypothetical protein